MNAIVEDEELARETLRYYNEQAQQWADHPDHSYHPFLAEVCDSLYPHGGPLLDIGCGTGRSIPVLLQMGVRRYIGIDLSSEMLRFAQKRFASRHEAAFKLGDICDLSKVVEEPANGFICAAMLMQVPKVRVPQALRSIRSVLQAGSLGFLTTPAGKYTLTLSNANKASIPAGYRLLLQQWPPEMLAHELELCGFEIIDAHNSDMMGEFLVRAV